MAKRPSPGNPFASQLEAARDTVAAIDNSKAYGDFVEAVRRETSWRFNGVKELDRYLHNVRRHLLHFAPMVLSHIDGGIRTVFDFGCGSGSGSIALALIFPEGTDRCQFECIGAGQALPIPSNTFDLCTCCSVLEYIVNPNVRKFCVQEMTRVLVPGGRLVMSVQNRLYPIELHSLKLGWNYFPKLLKARIVGASAWEVMKLARPHVLKLCSNPVRQLLAPWSNFCLRKES